MGERNDEAPHKFLIHYAGDDVGVAVRDIGKGEEAIGVYMDTEERVKLVARETIPLGHKIALRKLPADAPVREYRTQIGIASSSIAEGEHVHTHNVRSARWSFSEKSVGRGDGPHAADRVSA